MRAAKVVAAGTVLLPVLGLVAVARIIKAVGEAIDIANHEALAEAVYDEACTYSLFPRSLP